MNIESLPSDIRIKLASLKQRWDIRQGAVNAIYSAIRNIETQCMRFANLIRSAGSDAARSEYTLKLEAASDEHERLVQERNRLDAESRSAANDYNRAEDWVLRQGDGTRLRVIARRPTSYNAEKLAAVRSDIAKLQAELQQVEMSPLDRKSIEQAVTKRVQELTASCRLNVTGLRGDGPLSLELEGTERGLHRPFAFELLAWSDAEALTARLLAAIPHAEGLSLEEKAEARARLSARLLSAERAEEALIEAAEEVRIGIERRPDADVRAVLGLTLVAASEAEAA